MSRLIQHRRGNESEIPTLADGEIGITKDSKKLFYGMNGENIEVANKNDLGDLTQLQTENKNNLVEAVNENTDSLNHLEHYDAALLGFKPDPNFDNTQVYNTIAKHIEKKTAIYFHEGDYYWQELCITDNPNISFYGISTPYQKYGTTFHPFTSGQQYIFKLGGFEDFQAPDYDTYHGITLKGISIIGIAFTDQDKPVSKSCLYIEYVMSQKFDIVFYNNEGNALTIRNSWENDFDTLVFRPKEPAKTAQLTFDSADDDGQQNISNIHIKTLDAEYVNMGPVIYARRDQHLNNILIGDFQYEDVIPVQSDPDNTKYTYDEYQQFSKHPLFWIESVNGLTINNMNLSGIGKRFYIADDGSKNITTLFNLGNVNMSVGNIMYEGGGPFFTVCDGQGNRDTNVFISSLVSPFGTRGDYTSYFGDQSYRQLFAYNTLDTGTINIGYTNFMINVYGYGNTTDSIFVYPGQVFSYGNLFKILRNLYASSANYTTMQRDSSIKDFVWSKHGGIHVLSYKVSTPYTITVHANYTSTDTFNVEYYDSNDQLLDTTTFSSVQQYTDVSFPQRISGQQYFIFRSRGDPCNLRYVAFSV